MKNKDQKIAIIGGGYGGLAVGALLSKYGHKVSLYEAHSYLGGCASLFRSKGFTFDVGATTLSGLERERPLRILVDLLGISFSYETLDEPMRIHFSDGTSLIRYRDHQKFLGELQRVFPHFDHATFWATQRDREQRLWKVLSAGQHFPPKNIKDILALTKPSIVKEAELGLRAFKPLKLPSTAKTIPKLEKEKLQRFLDEQLMISTQAKLGEVPELMGAMGLVYPEDMHYPWGGISSLAYKLKDFMKEHKSEVILNAKVKKVTRIKRESGNDGFEIFGEKQRKDFSEKFDLVISNLPLWNTPELLDKELLDELKTPKQIDDECWGAVTANFAIKTKTPINPLYHQVHYQNNPLGEDGSYFFSFSHPKDRERAPEDWQTVTVSTHTRVRDWEESFKNGSYDSLKKHFQQSIKAIFDQRFKDFEILDYQDFGIGTPHTFKHYTGRHRGMVGGLPHNGSNHILNYPQTHSGIKNFYRVGDTTFPGQGIVGVATGALMLAGHLTNKNLLL